MGISAIIPAKNEAQWIKRAIESVLNQTHPADEVIVVINGLDDSTASIAGKMGGKVKVIESEPGVEHARNLGVATAGEEWVAFLDADDRWLPRKLERQMRLAAENPDLCAISTWGHYEFEGRRLGNYCAGPWRGHHLKEFRDRAKPIWLITPSVLVKKETIQSLGGFDPDFKGAAEDLDMWTRLAYSWPTKTVPEDLVAVTIRCGSVSMKEQARLQQNTRFLRHRCRQQKLGQPAGTLTKFRIEEANAPARQKLEWRRKALAGGYLRTGTGEWLGGRRVRGAGKLIASVALDPRHCWRKIQDLMKRK